MKSSRFKSRCGGGKRLPSQLGRKRSRRKPGGLEAIKEAGNRIQSKGGVKRFPKVAAEAANPKYATLPH
jgi:hypothetical protein